MTLKETFKDNKIKISRKSKDYRHYGVIISEDEMFVTIETDKGEKQTIPKTDISQIKEAKR